MLGIPGLTAYVAVERFADLKPGDTVYVSAAAGAVGSLVGQLAKLKGAGRVIGSAGSAQKVAELKENFGFDDAFNYKDAPIAEQLAALAPDGVDVVFDGVGGEAMEAGIGALRIHGRFVIIGMLSQYNNQSTAGPRNMWNLSVTRSSMRAFMVSEEFDLRDPFITEVSGLIADGRVQYRETFFDGLGTAPAALLSLMRGGNMGKMVVKL